eukprot:CAMPEP_0181424312 /NCGR_PEP_ID=MMETSP1110-20121109/14579_1 /TAXON_ID=174948 /ORGANISM="Symbiodinium sp., Strain CCMP421" /LENGTH=498 /DNA_ID=CAMNT_0023547465 /DNA_START=31 /DNA_END=1527 /DNA_ORIENTATION=-
MSTMRKRRAAWSLGPRKRRRDGAERGPMEILRPSDPVGEPWPVSDLRAFDAPTEPFCEINYGPMLREVLRARGWRYSCGPCHGVYDEDTDKSTFYIKEFEACLRGKTPKELFGKDGVQEDGYRLQALKLPRHALWMIGRLPYRVPGTARDQCRDREDFVQLVLEHGQGLPGKPGNYRIAKFPGTERILFKTNFSKAFKDKPWYPKTFILPEDRPSFLREVRVQQKSLWIGKPRNDYGGAGICVWKATDPGLRRAVTETKSSRSIVQQYIANPLLIGGYKFHMRIHLVITNLSPLEAFIQENGQCLFATKPYRMSSGTLGAHFDPPVHVTNMGLNATPENKDNFLKEKPVIGKGQQIRVRQLMAHLASMDPTFDKAMIWQQILDISMDTAEYISRSIRRRYKVMPDRHFEIFGMDLMLDKKLKVWMCEVNTDPGLGYPDKEVLGSPNPDYKKELTACEETLHDLFSLLGLDAGLAQTQGSLRHWFKLERRALPPKADKP